MALLTAHLLESGDHGRLGFHPRCPVCRDERLFGRLPADAVVSLRARAALASGVLAVSAAGVPAAAFAQEQDQRTDGVTAPAAPESSPDENLGFTPGAEMDLPGEGVGQAPPTTTEPSAPAGPPREADPQDALPLESEPVQDPVPVAPEEPAPSDLETTEPSSPALGAEGEAPAAPTESGPDDLIFDGEDESTPSTDGPSGLDADPPRRYVDRPAKPDRASTDAPTRAPATAVAPPLTHVAPPAVAEAPASAPTQPVVAQDPVPPIDGPTHLVRPGDSLWSIAKRLLGSGASTAEIARKVDRLWTLNADRIGTGDPDLLMVGTELRLR